MALEPTPRSFAELDEQVACGLPSAALKALIERISLRPDEHNGLLHRSIPKSTLMRRSAHLSPGESEKPSVWHAISQPCFKSGPRTKRRVRSCTRHNRCCAIARLLPSR